MAGEWPTVAGVTVAGESPTVAGESPTVAEACFCCTPGIMKFDGEIITGQKKTRVRQIINFGAELVAAGLLVMSWG